MTTSTKKLAFSTVPGLVMCLLAVPSWAVTLHVENWGVDSGSCGTTVAPCRSIGNAATLAAAGDTILVGPGSYSNDLDGDSIYDEPGEEPSGGISVSGITVKSSHGAAATRIEYTGARPAGGVIIGSSNAFIGKRNHGFGILVTTTSGTLPSCWVGATGGGGVSGNQLVITDSGAFVGGICAAGGGVVVRDNRVVGTTPPAFLAGVIASDGVVERNVVTGGSGGFFAGFAGTKLHRNVAIGNQYGFFLNGTVTEFTTNIAVTNSSYGVQLDVGASVTGNFKNNTIAGNDSSTNCGLYNNSGGTLLADKNFWGAATGPGVDPADAVCDAGGSTTTVTTSLTHGVAPGPGAVQ